MSGARELFQKPFGALLGAGASVEAGLPTSNELTLIALRESDSESLTRTVFRRLYGVIAGAIIHRNSQNGRNPIETPVNVEDIAEALSLLRTHKRWKFGELFGAIDPAIPALERDYQKLGQEGAIVRQLTTAFGSDGTKRTNAIAAAANLIASGQFTFPDMYSQALSELRQICFHVLERPPNPFNYLDRLASCNRLKCLATLNFDTLFERTCAKVGRTADVGVYGWKRGRLNFVGRALPIIKLHGSVDWVTDYDKAEVDESGRPIGAPKISHGKPDHGFHSGKRPTVLFGAASKLRADGPYLDLLAKFEREIEKVSSLAVIGYSFADEHINDVLRGWLAFDKTNSLAVASGPNFFASEEDYQIFFQEWNPDQVEVTKLKASEAISQWFTPLRS